MSEAYETKNSIDSAVELMENGWCISELKETVDETGEEVPLGIPGQDRYCAVGAVAEAKGILKLIVGDQFTYVDEAATYGAFNELPEAKVLAATVIGSDWFAKQSAPTRRDLGRNAVEGSYDEVVFLFNDSQKDKQPVIDLFKIASERFDDENC